MAVAAMAILYNEEKGMLVETVVQLVRKMPDTHIDFEISIDEFNLTAAESKATYQEIKNYVLEKYGLKASTLYISQVKAKCGIIDVRIIIKAKMDIEFHSAPRKKKMQLWMR